MNDRSREKDTAPWDTLPWGAAISPSSRSGLLSRAVLYHVEKSHLSGEYAQKGTSRASSAASTHPQKEGSGNAEKATFCVLGLRSKVGARSPAGRPAPELLPPCPGGPPLPLTSPLLWLMGVWAALTCPLQLLGSRTCLFLP